MANVKIYRKRIEKILNWMHGFRVLRPAVDMIDIAIIGGQESMDLREFGYGYAFVLPYDAMWNLLSIIKARHPDAKLALCYEEEGMGKIIRVRQYTFEDLGRTDVVGGIMGFRYRIEDLIEKIGSNITLPRIVNIKTKGRYVRNVILDNGLIIRKSIGQMASRIKEDDTSFCMGLEMRLPFIVLHLPEDPIMDIEFMPNVNISEIEFLGVVFEVKQV